MGRKKKLLPDDPGRSARFMEMAEQIQDEHAEERFQEIVSKVLRPKQPRKEKRKQ